MLLFLSFLFCLGANAWVCLEKDCERFPFPYDYAFPKIPGGCAQYLSNTEIPDICWGIYDDYEGNQTMHRGAPSCKKREDAWPVYDREFDMFTDCDLSGSYYCGYCEDVRFFINITV